MLLRKLAAQILAKRPNEFAPGIPSNPRVLPLPTVKEPQKWEAAIQHHHAVRSGHHIDLRLIDPDEKAHSWALPKAKLPEPGERVLAIPQPTHTREYAGRKGEFHLIEGYGRGKVIGSGLMPTEVVSARPGAIKFNLYSGKDGVQEYALFHTPRGGILQNITATAERGVPGFAGSVIPNSKPPYREMHPEAVRFDNEDEVHQAKVDGAHVTFHLQDGKPMKVFSYRPTERSSGVIEHTHKLQGFHKLIPPHDLDRTVLRGELYGEKDGKAIPAETTGGLLNATVWTSRQKQRETGTQLKPVIYDVVKYRGKDMQDAPYREKLTVLQQVAQKFPFLQLPPTGRTETEKRELFNRIQSGQEPITSEGIVSWHLDKPYPTKAKFRPDVDAEVVGVTTGQGKFKDSIGALKVRLPGKEAVTHVGTGLSEELRREIAKNPQDYIGRVVKVRTQQVFASGKMRAPSFGGWHIEKGKQKEAAPNPALVMREIAEHTLRAAPYFTKRKPDRDPEEDTNQDKPHSDSILTKDKELNVST
jgi:hypothetical protein